MPKRATNVTAPVHMVKKSMTEYGKGSRRARLIRVVKTTSTSDGDGGKGPRIGVSMTGKMPDGSKVTMGLSKHGKTLAMVTTARPD